MCILLTFAIWATITSVYAMEYGINFAFQKSNPEVIIMSYNPAVPRIHAVLKEGDYRELIIVDGGDDRYVSWRETCVDLDKRKRLVEYGVAAHTLFTKLVQIQTKQQEKAALLKATQEAQSPD